MSQTSYSQLVADINSTIPDNTLRRIKPAHVRQRLLDIVDSVPVVSGTPTNGQSLVWSNFYNAFIGSGVVGTGGGGGSGNPEGSDKQLQYNNAGLFGGLPLTYDNVNNELSTDSVMVFRANIINGLGTSLVGVDVTNGSLYDFNGQAVVDWGDGNFHCNASGLFTNNIVQTDKLSTFTTSALGTSQSSTVGLLLTNTTSATNGAQQISPAVRWQGQGFKTTGSLSQPVDFRSYVLPNQGTSAVGGLWKLQSSVNNGSYTDRLVVDTSGNIAVGSLRQGSQVVVESFKSEILLLAQNLGVIEINPYEIDIVTGAENGITLNYDGGTYIWASGNNAQLSLLGNHVSITGIIDFEHNVRQTFNPGSSQAGINVGSVTSDPSSLVNGDIWHTAGKLKARIGGTTVTIGASGAGGGGGDLLSTNNLSDLANSGIALTNLGVTTFGKQWLATTNSGSALNNLGVTSFGRNYLAFNTSLEAFSLTSGNLSLVGSIVSNIDNNKSINWSDRQLFDNISGSSVDWNSRILFDAGGLGCLDWAAGHLLRSSDLGQVTLDWQNSLLIDDGLQNSIDWQNRQLLDSVGNFIVDWNTPANVKISGNISFEHGKRQTFNPSLALPGFNPGSVTADPTTTINGDIWYNSTSNFLKTKANSTVTPIMTGAGNLSELANSGTALTNLGVTSYAKNLLAVNTSGHALDILGVTSYAQSILANQNSNEMRLNLGLGTTDIPTMSGLIINQTVADIHSSGLILKNNTSGAGAPMLTFSAVDAVYGPQRLDIRTTPIGSGSIQQIYYINDVAALDILLVNNGATIHPHPTGPLVWSLNADGSASFATGLFTVGTDGHITTSGTMALEHGKRQTFNPSLANAGLNVGSVTADPTTLVNGDIWYDSVTAGGSMKMRIGGNTVTIGPSGAGGGGGLLAANNLSELSATSGTALTNLGVTTFAKSILAVNASGNLLDIAGVTSFAKNLLAVNSSGNALDVLGVTSFARNLLAVNASGNALDVLGVTSYGKQLVANTTGAETISLIGQSTSTTTQTAAGTAYSLTNTAAAVTFGTTSPAITIPAAGTWRVHGWCHVYFNGASFAADQTVTIKLRRTNNTAGDLTSASVSLHTGIVTTLTATMAIVSWEADDYTTSNSNDSLTIFASVGTTPSAGSLQIDQAKIYARRIF